MKNILFILICFICSDLFGISSYNINDELFVWAKSGLNLRATPEPGGEVVTKIPFGSLVLPQTSKAHWEYVQFKYFVNDNNKNADGTVSTVKLYGNWIYIKFGSHEGYVFDAYLSKIRPGAIGEMRDSGIFGFLRSQTELLHEEKSNRDGEIGYEKKIFKNGFVQIDYWGEFGGQTEIVAPNFSKEEFFIMVRIMDGYSERITQKENQIVIQQEMGEYIISNTGATVVLHGSWGC